MREFERREFKRRGGHVDPAMGDIEKNYDEMYKLLVATDKLVAECSKPVEYIRFTRIKLALMLTCLQEAQSALVKTATPAEIELLMDQTVILEIIRRLECNEDTSPKAVMEGVRNYSYLKPAENPRICALKEAFGNVKAIEGGKE